MDDMLTPDSQWTWYLDTETSALGLNLSNRWFFQTAYTAKQLNNNVESRPFSAEDCQYYMEAVESLLALNSTLTSAECMQIALNATAYYCFGKELSPKSWYFDQHIPRQDELRLASLVANGAIANVFIVEQQGDFTVCLTLMTIKTKSGKALETFSPVKVSNQLLNATNLFESPEHFIKRA